MVTRKKGLGATAGLLPVEFNYLSTAVDNVSQTTFTFSAQTIGNVTSPHHVAVLITSGTSGGTAVTSVTVDGQACDIIIQQDGSATRSIIAVTSATITATSGDIVVTYAAGVGSCRLGLYEVFNLDSTTPIASGSAGGTASSTLAANLTSVEDGFALITAGHEGVTGAATFSADFTKDYDAAVGSRESVGASALTVGSTVEVDMDLGSSFREGYCWVTFR